jgi:hypothetical protein
MGFNLMWGNVFADQVEIKCVSNCAVDVDDAGRPKIDTLHQGVHGLANDLLGDEFVKVRSGLVECMQCGCVLT